MYQLYVKGDRDAALDIHYGLHPLVDLLFVETNPAPVKWVLAHRGLIRSGHVRPPLVAPSDAGLTTIRALLAEGASYLSPVEGFTIGDR
jgi:4-hydroxy-tetrahydrodipicolinate synthase